MKPYLFLIIVILALVGCEQESAAPNQSGKLLPPIEATLEVNEQSLSTDQIELNLNVRFENNETKAKALLVESGVIRRIEDQESVLEEWSNIKKGSTFSVPLKLKAEGKGKGSIKVKVEAYDEQGRFKYGMNPSVYFLVSDEEILSGNNGFMELEIQHLNHLKEQGKISEEEYKKQKEEISKKN